MAWHWGGLGVRTCLSEGGCEWVFETLSAPGVGGSSGGRSAGAGLPGEWVGPWVLAAVALPREHPCPGLGGPCVG